MIYIKLAALLFVQLGGWILSVVLGLLSVVHLPYSLFFFPIAILTLAGTMYLSLKVGPDLLGQIE
jgi:hypothetical protein